MNIKIENLGEFIKKKRKEAEKTLKDISSVVDVSTGYISRIENNSSVPSLETLYNLSNILNFKIEDVCEFADIDLNIDEAVNIEDLFKSYKIKINGNLINDIKKFQMVKLLNIIEAINWNDEYNKISNLNQVLMIINQIKKGA